MGFETEIQQNKDLALKDGKLEGALENLLTLEKTARLKADIPGTSELAVAIVQICWEAKNYQQLNDHIVLLAKRRAQLKQAIQKMVQECAKYVDETTDIEKKVELINTLRTVTEGKMFVEVERARLTKILAAYHEGKGDIEKARDIMQDTQVETLGGMDKREKTEFILEQIRMCLDTVDYVRAYIVAKKIQLKVFKDTELADLKIRYYTLVNKYHMHKEQHFEIFNCYKEMWDTPKVQEDTEHAHKVLKNMVLFLVLSEYNNEQKDQMHHLLEEKVLPELPIFKTLLTKFTTEEIFSYQAPEVQGAISAELPAVLVDYDEKTAASIMEALKKRIVQHNIQVIAKYYSRIRAARLSQLLNLTGDEMEAVLSDMVTTKMLWARIDRPAGIIAFTPPKEPNELLNEWAGNISTLLNLVEGTCHLIHKENMIHKISS